METLNTIRPELLSLSEEQFHALMPYFWVFGGTLVAILASVLRFISPKWPVFILTLITCGFGISDSSQLMHQSALPLFNGMMISDSYSNFFNILFLAAAFFTAIISFRYLDHEKLQHPEYYVLLLFSALGMMLMASSLDLIVIFIALELMSLAVYVLVGFRRTDRRSNEGAIKYFILGSAASAVLLYGTALLYGSTGSMNVKAVLTFVQANPHAVTPVFVLGVVLVLFGFLFKIAAVPFHMWMPDVYEGAPVPITGFMTTGLKAAAFAAFIRVFVSMGLDQSKLAAVQGHIHDFLWVCAVLTMIVGNFVALTQTNLKRMLAYSSIAHTGYLLIGMIAGSKSELGYAPAVFYVTVYAVMNLGAFVVLSLLAARNDSGLNLHDLSGMSKRHPWISFALAVFMLSMAGIPPMAGFTSKYLLFYSAIQANEVILVIIGVLCSAVSVYYYLRVLVYMYMREPAGSPAVLRVPVWSSLALASMILLTLQMGILPSRMIDIAKKAISSL